MKPKQRWLILGSLLVATLGAGYFAEDEAAVDKGKRKSNPTGKGVAAAGAGENRRATRGDKPGEVAAMPLDFPEPAVVAEGAEEGTTIDPFRGKTWFIPPPPPPPAKPTAPPLPFQFLGKLIEDGETRVFLNHQGKHLIARVGDVINGTYTVEAIAGGKMSFLYMPLKESQVLAIGADK